MPQLQPGQVQPGQDNAPKLYGLEKTENAIPFQERLMRLFKPQEFVTIKNVDDEPCYWQYMPAENEQENFSEDGMQKIITRSNPEMWVIQPGETEVLVGANAYRALDVMYKAYTAKSTLRKFKDPTQPQFNEKNEHLPKNFNFADGGAQDRFLDIAYIGKATPSFQPTAVAQATTVPQMAMTSAPTQSDVAPMNGQMDDPNAPKPKTTEGAPLKAPEYADPDKEATNKAKELVNASTTKK
jgi:hypothetical protein